MVEDEIENIKQDPSFLPKEIKFYNNKYREHVPIITLNKNSYIDKDGNKKNIDNAYKLRRAYAEFLVASSQNMDSKKYQRQIYNITNGKKYTGTIKISDQTTKNQKTINTSTISKKNIVVKQQIVPDMVFTKNQVRIGANTYPSNPVIERDYNDYKKDKNHDSIERVLEDIKILEDNTQVKDNTENRVKTLSSIFKHNQSLLNNTKPTSSNISNIQNVNTDTNTSTHINIVQPTKKGARLMDMYQ